MAIQVIFYFFRFYNNFYIIADVNGQNYRQVGFGIVDLVFDKLHCIFGNVPFFQRFKLKNIAENNNLNIITSILEGNKLFIIKLYYITPIVYKLYKIILKFLIINDYSFLNILTVSHVSHVVGIKHYYNFIIYKQFMTSNRLFYL